MSRLKKLKHGKSTQLELWPLLAKVPYAFQARFTSKIRLGLFPKGIFYASLAPLKHQATVRFSSAHGLFKIIVRPNFLAGSNMRNFPRAMAAIEGVTEGVAWLFAKITYSNHRPKSIMGASKEPWCFRNNLRDSEFLTSTPSSMDIFFYSQEEVLLQKGHMVQIKCLLPLRRIYNSCNTILDLSRLSSGTSRSPLARRPGFDSRCRPRQTGGQLLQDPAVKGH